MMVDRDPIPLADVRAQYGVLQAEIDEVVRSVLASGHYVLGPQVEALEQELADYCGTAQAVGVASGTDALELALRACNIGPGDEVIVPALSFVATAIAVVLAGATPVFVDIVDDTCTLDPDRLEQAITPRTKAVLPVHLYGHPCDMDAVMSIAKAAQLRVVEDCAQAIGATYRGQPVGGFGDAAGVSFYPSKNLGACGDGGMLLTNDAELAARVRALRWYGSPDRVRSEWLGRNSRLDELQSAILRVKLRHLDQWNALRRQHAHTYTDLLSQARLDSVTRPETAPECTSVFHLFPVRLADRDRVRHKLISAGIGVQVHYACTLPQHPALQSYSASGTGWPVAEAVVEQTLSLPMYPELTSVQIERVVQAVSAAVRPA